LTTGHPEREKEHRKSSEAAFATAPGLFTPSAEPAEADPPPPTRRTPFSHSSPLLRMGLSAKAGEPWFNTVKPKNTESPATVRSGRGPAGVPEPTIIEPLPLNRKAAAKRSPRTLWKAALTLGILASVVCGSGFLLNHLSKRSRPEPVETLAQVPGQPGTPQPVQAPEDKTPPLPEKHAKEERQPAVAGQNQGAAETKAEGSLPARREKDQGSRKSVEERFHRHLSGGLTAYHEKNYALARSELTKARELKPNAPEVLEALAQVEAAVRLQSMGDFQARAAEAEALEDWAKASDLYAAALALDGTLQFAVQGRERSLQRMEMDKRLQFYLQKPEALWSDESLARAAEVLNRAEGIEPKGPRLNHQLEAFRRLVKEAQIQIRVTLVSDNLTEVSVYRVGRLGRFTAQELLLRPGRYTVVGTREGYKDVRQEVLVKPGEAPLQVTITCREKV